MTCPLVSVVLPTFNRAWTLKDAVDSVLFQDYPYIELIVVDDGSDDDTQTLLDKYKDKLIVLKQENSGVSAARNAGIKNSRGELIALLDSDDAWDSRKISCQVAFFEQNPDALICQTEEIWIRKGKRVNPKVKHQKPSGMIFEQSLFLCLVSPSAVMMRRRLFDLKGYFNEAFTVCEDYDLWLRIGCRHHIHLLRQEQVFKTGGHSDQLSARYRGMDRFRIESMIKLIKSGQLNKKQKNACLEEITFKCRIYSEGCLKRGRLNQGRFYSELPKNLKQDVLNPIKLT